MEKILNEVEVVLKNVREICPLVHQITNYVTVNDCANLTAAIGASPIMADAIEEVEDIVSISNALVINIGTLNSRTVASMLLAGKTANQKSIPVVLDPVGAGASKFRNETTLKLLQEVKFAVIKGNVSEIGFIAGANATTRGVDASAADLTKMNKKQLAELVANKYGCVVALTGTVDVISDGKVSYSVQNGHALMGKISGTGCMLGAVIAAFYAANKSNSFVATVVAVLSMGIIGEIAASVGKNVGSFHVEIFNAAQNLTPETVKKMAKVSLEK